MERLIRVGAFIFLSMCLPLVSGCGLLEEPKNILDAAQLYKERADVFNRIRLRFPGPFADFRRIPALEEADDRPEDIQFLEALKASLQLETLTLYIWRENQSDVIDVGVDANGLAQIASVVSLVYFESFARDAVVEEGVEVFDNCDERSLHWLETVDEKGFVAAYCRINEHWYAHQWLARD